MENHGHGRTTFVLTKNNLCTPHDGIFQIMNLIESGDESRKIYAAIVDEALTCKGCLGAALLLHSAHGGDKPDTVGISGDFDTNLSVDSFKPARPFGQGYLSFDVVCLGAPLGNLVINFESELQKEDFEQFRSLAHCASVAFERQRNATTIQTLLDRLEVLNELNQLIASNTDLKKLMKNLARESAFRFAADVTVAFLLDESKTSLRTFGGYGCTQTQVPETMNIDAGLLGQVLRTGGHVSIATLAAHTNHGLDFVEAFGIKSAEICCLEVRGDALGILLNGFRREAIPTADDLTRFEEFCQGAAVAIANARNRERIQEYTNRLEELVNQRTADLEVQTHRAEEANQAKSRFLANMSHELRTPLTAIVGYSSVLADGIFGELNDKQKDALGAVVRSSEHLKNLIDDVLNLARIESGKEQPEPIRVGVQEVLQGAVKLMLQTAIGKGVSIQPVKLDPAVSGKFVYADAKHVHQVLINLMSNAVKYTPHGGKVWVDASVVSDKIRITISDSGVGIPEDKKEKLFERFERGEDTYSKSQEGTGIGLNLTRHLVEINGGRIGVESQEGKGSTFWVMLPLAAEESLGSSAVATGHKDSSQRLRLDGLSALVVDDNRDTCEVLRQVLQSAGAEVRTAENVRQGITKIEDDIPDIVLTDLAMPGESGIFLIEHIRKANLPQIPIIVLSACAFESDKQTALDAGASIFIPKPFSPQEVVKTVRQLTLQFALNSGKSN